MSKNIEQKNIDDFDDKDLKEISNELRKRIIQTKKLDII